MVFTSADNQARSRFYKKARNTLTSFQGGVFLGELREAIQLLKPTKSALMRGIEDGYLGAVKRRIEGLNKRRLPASLRNRTLKVKKDILAETWLEYSFGLSPLVSDLDAARREIARYASHKAFSVRIQAGGSEEEMSSADAGALTSTWGSVSYRVARRYKVDVRYIGAVGIETGFGQRSIRQSLGLTWDQFVPTMWELIPYSFLVDYFANVGDLVSAASFPKSSFRWYLRGTKWENTHTHVSGPFTRPQNTSQTVYSGGGFVGQSTLKRYGVNRTPLSGSPPIPSLVLKVPGLPRQFFNLAALGVTHRKVLKSIQ
jgi:hypothetical protein